MITTVIFDMDDTLYDEIDYCRSAFSATAKYIVDNLQSPDTVTTEQAFNALWVQFNTGNQKTTFNTALDIMGIEYDTELIKTLVKVYREHTPNIQLPSESRAILDQLSLKYSLALLTDGFLPAQRLKVNALGIKKYFDPIIFTEEIGREFWKPSPVGFKKILEILNQTSENCIYIADNAEKDFIAPNQLGMTTIQLIRPKKVHKAAPASKIATPDYKITDFNALNQLLAEL